MKPMLKFPPGYRFLPTDSELLVHYLNNKNAGLPLPAQVMQEIDIYNFNPDDLASQFAVEEEKDMYFFTQRNRKYEGGSRPTRKAGNGYWKATTRHTTVLDQDKVVGYKMNLKFHVGTAPKGKKTDWLMTEYRIKEVDPPTMSTATEAGNGKRKRNMMAATQEDHHIRMNGFVLCKIYKNRWEAKKYNETLINEVIEENCRSYIAPCFEDQTNIINYKGMPSSTSSWDVMLDEITPQLDRLLIISWDNNEYIPPLPLTDFNMLTI